jgi:hypothetical protein
MFVRDERDVVRLVPDKREAAGSVDAAALSVEEVHVLPGEAHGDWFAVCLAGFASNLTDDPLPACEAKIGISSFSKALDQFNCRGNGNI